MSHKVIIGIGEDLGFPYSYQNSKKRCLHQQVLYQVSNYYDKKYILNLFSMLLNKTKDFDTMLNKNISTLKELRQDANEQARDTLFTKIGMPKLDDYNPSNIELDEEITLKELIKNNNCLILYSYGINDLFQLFDHSFFYAYLDYKKTKEALELMKDKKHIDTVIKRIEKQIKTIKEINQNTSIYVVGFSIDMYTPKLYLKAWKDKKSYTTLIEYFNYYNEELEKICNKYNITFNRSNNYQDTITATTDLTIKILLKEKSSN